MTQENNTKNKATIFLVSGELDKALAAFEVATGMAAMGVQVNMWFIFYGINSIKKPRSFTDRLKYFYKVMRAAPGRVPDTDVYPQRLIPFLNHASARTLPLSQLNYLGVGPLLVNYVFRQKNSPVLEQMVKEAESLGITFRICQPCVDVLMLDVEEDLLVDAKVSGVSSYTMDAMNSHYNVIF